MTVRVCSHRLSMQSDVLNDQQQQISNDTDCSSTLATTLIYSGLKLHQKPLVPTLSMSNMPSPVSIVKKLSLSDTHPDNSTKTLGTTTPSSIRLVTPTTGKSSPPTALQFQFLDKTSTPTSNGGYSSSKTYILNSSTNHSTGTNSSPLVTLIPPGTTSPKIQTLISSTNDSTTNQEQNNSKQTTTPSSSFLSKSRVTFVPPLIANSSIAANNSVTPKLVIQQNSTSNIWSSQPKTKILSAKMLPRSVHLISSNEHSNLSSPTSHENPLLTSKNLDSGHQTFFHMSLLPSNTSSDTINSVQLTNLSSVRISTTTTQRSMDHNNNHHTTTTPIVREMTIDEKLNDSNSNQTKHSIKNRTRLPLQPSTQQISSILPTSKKHKLSDDEQSSLCEPPTKIAHYEQFDSTSNGKTSRKCRQKLSIENTTPPSTNSESNHILPSKKRSSAEQATAAILSTNSFRKKRLQKKLSEDSHSNTNQQTKQDLITPEMINDELLKRLSQDFVHVDQRTGIRWIATKTRSQPINTLSARVSWKPKINHYEKYSDIIRTNSKRTVPIQSPEIIRKKLTESNTSWRIERLTTSLTDLTQNEQLAQKNLSDIALSLDQLNIDDHSIRNAIGDLIEGNVQRHRYFCEHLSQISSLLSSLLDHGNTLKDICTNVKNSTNPRKLKER